MKLEVDTHVARGPLVEPFAHMKGLTSGIKVKEDLYVAEVVSRGVHATLILGTVHIKVYHLIWRLHGFVAEGKGGTTSKLVDKGVSVIALNNERSTLGYFRQHGVIDSLIDDLDDMICLYTISAYHLYFSLGLINPLPIPKLARLI